MSCEGCAQYHQTNLDKGAAGAQLLRHTFERHAFVGVAGVRHLQAQQFIQEASGAHDIVPGNGRLLFVQGECQTGEAFEGEHGSERLGVQAQSNKLLELLQLNQNRVT